MPLAGDLSGGGRRRRHGGPALCQTTGQTSRAPIVRVHSLVAAQVDQVERVLRAAANSDVDQLRRHWPRG